MKIKNLKQYLYTIGVINKSDYKRNAFIILLRYEWEVGNSQDVSFVFHLIDQGDFPSISLNEANESDFKYQLRTYGFGVALGKTSEEDEDVILKYLKLAYGDDVNIEKK